MNKFMKSLAANMKQVRAEYTGTEDPFEKLNLAWEVARLMLESLDTIIEMAAQIEALEAINVANDLMKLDEVRCVDASEKIEPDDFAEDLAVLLKAKFEDALNRVYPYSRGVSGDGLNNMKALIEAGFARVNEHHQGSVIITQRGIDHFKSML